MRGIVWYYKDASKGLEMLQRIIDGYKQQGIKIAPYRTAYTLSHFEATVEFENGDIWSVYNASESRRGYNCNISYISWSIPEEIVNVVIKPITMAPPFQGMIYWHEEPGPIAVPQLDV